MYTLTHSIKLAVSMVVSDDTGELLQLIRGITILCWLCISMIQVVLPVLEWVNSAAIGMQQIWLTLKTYPIEVMVTG